MFQKYYQHNRSASLGASLAPTGLLSIGQMMREEYSLTAGQRVELFFDIESKRIGIRPCDPDQSPPGSAKITALTRGLGISMRGMATKYNISPGRFTSEYDSDLSLIVLSREENR